MHLLPLLHQFGQNAVQRPLQVKDVVGALRELLGDLRMGRSGWGRRLRGLPVPADAPRSRTEPPRGLTLCSLVFTTATSFRAGTPLPAGTASYLKKVRKRIFLKQNISPRQPSPGQRKSIPWRRRCRHPQGTRGGGFLGR